MGYRQQPPKPKGGFYPQTKVYSDGSHYIAIPHTERPYKPKRKHIEEIISVPVEPNTLTAKNINEPTLEDITVQPVEKPLLPVNYPRDEVYGQANETPQDAKESPKIVRKLTYKELFNELYAETVGLKKAKRHKTIVAAMLPYFNDGKSATDFVNKNFERKRRNLISRRIRLSRKINLQDFNYFVTFTYNDALHTENTFKKKLKNCLSLFCSRKAWKYVGVWERSPKKRRLHFHGLFDIPQGTMPGYIIEVNDYSLITHKRQITHQNTYFNDRFGRSDFEAINDNTILGRSVAYIMKYIEKTGEKIMFSKGLPQYFITDIMTEDIICPIGLEDSKLLLFDDFNCWDEGILVGKAGKDTIRQLPKANN